MSAVDAVAACVDQPWVVCGVAVVEAGAVDAEVSPASERTSRFEIGSITKTMTAAALALLTLDGTLSLGSPIRTWLDAGENGDITVGQLATHTSGLPRLAPNHARVRSDPDQPYANFTAAAAEEGLRESVRGEGRLYSNFGMQLLGLVLERASGMSFDALLRERLWASLGMDGTSVIGEQVPVVQGYDDDARAVPAWVGALPGPGLVTSTIDDMARFTAAVVSPPDSPVGRAIQHTLDANLGWSARPEGWFTHDGGTAGASSFLAVRPEHGIGAVGMVNTHNDDLQDAVWLAAAGRDPSQVRPSPASDIDRARVETVVALIAAGDWSGLHEVTEATAGTKLTPELVGSTWTSYTAQLGNPTERTVESIRRQSGAVKAVAAIHYGEATRRIRLWLNDDGQVVGLRV